MKCLSTRTKIGLILALVLLTVLLSIFGCTATHAQLTFGTGKDGVAAATAMAAGDPHPAAPGGIISSESKRTITRAARD